MFIRRVLKPWVLKPFCPVSSAGAGTGAVVVAAVVGLASLTLAIILTSERAWGEFQVPVWALKLNFQR
ncbi:MAG: hypothetical protein IPK68_03875 [Bdellovibrionales bacterium]|nr:hypothetical protein [Bdellovibrionales bacterium]